MSAEPNKGAPGFEAKYRFVLWWQFEVPQHIGLGYEDELANGLAIITAEEHRRRAAREDALERRVAQLEALLGKTP